MATRHHKLFCILEFARCNFVITVQRRFRLRYQIGPPNGWKICNWYYQFVDKGCGCKGKRPGRPRVSEVKQLFNGVLQNQLVVLAGSKNSLQQLGVFCDVDVG
ncbi:hypothetical protein C0J52_19809 [Blattella germanica]|nr:hypothetical protein C0J52_19809 [Blattella germanica]